MREKSGVSLVFVTSVILLGFSLWSGSIGQTVIAAALISLTMAYNFVIRLKTTGEIHIISNLNESNKQLDLNLKAVENRLGMVERELARIGSMGVF